MVHTYPHRTETNNSSKRYKLCVQPDDLNYPEDNPAANAFDENQPQKMFKEKFYFKHAIILRRQAIKLDKGCF